jgi:hypothetical protein
MKKILLLPGAAFLSLILFTSCDRKDQDQVTQFYHSVVYNFGDGVDYFTADLLACYGVKDVTDPSIGTIHATISIKANRNCLLLFKGVDGSIDDTYVTEHSVYPLVYYPSTPFSQEYSMVQGQVIVLNLEFHNVPSRLLKVGRLRVAVDVNSYKKYAFTFYQIPFKPDTDTIDWN